MTARQHRTALAGSGNSRSILLVGVFHVRAQVPAPRTQVAVPAQERETLLRPATAPQISDDVTADLLAMRLPCEADMFQREERGVRLRAARASAPPAIRREQLSPVT